MKRISVVLVILILAFIVGACLGGYLAGHFGDEYLLRSSAGQANIALGTLMRLREHKIDEAIEIQEIILGGKVADFNYFAPLIVEKQDTNINRLMYQIKDYYLKYPPNQQYVFGSEKELFRKLGSLGFDTFQQKIRD